MTDIKPSSTVFVVDDDDAMRSSLQWLIESIGMKVETYDSAQGFLDNYHPARAGCLLLDVRMPGMSGLELQKILQAQGICIPVIIITGHGDVSMAVRAMKSGAIDFIEKPFNDEVLLDSIRNAMQKDDALRASQNQTAEVMSNYTHLTPREKEVMSMVTEGRSNKEISSLLNISAKTVEAHRARVMDKMSANSLAKLVRYAIIVSTELS